VFDGSKRAIFQRRFEFDRHWKTSLHPVMKFVSQFSFYQARLYSLFLFLILLNFAVQIVSGVLE
jgi:hypothetical protein